MHIHILGICGTFMGGLAALARAAGHRVTGCDAGVYPPMSDQLRALGIDLIEGFDADQLDLKADMWVIGNVVSRARLGDNTPKFPLMEAILDAGLPYTSGPQWLSEHILQGRHVLAVAGTHGKTTTSAMIAWILQDAGFNPSFLIGGVPLNFDASARLTDSPYFVIEADEYDTAFFDKRSKFVHYKPRTAVLNNLEFDHADIFDSIADIERQFHHLVRTVPSAGQVVVNADEPALQRVLDKGCWSTITRFGQSSQAQWSARDANAKDLDAQVFSVSHQNQSVGAVHWELQGHHNRMNALAAIAAASHLGVNAQTAMASLGRFQSVKRRMELIGTAPRQPLPITVYDDFAHHPTAIASTLDGLRRHLKNGERILAVFEPRSNTMKLGTMKAALPRSLQSADLAFCYAGGLDWDARQALLPMSQRAVVADTLDELIAAVAHAASPGDHIVCMSNGSFGGVHAKLLAALRA